MPKKKRLDETHVYALCEHCGTRDVMSRRAWDNGFRPLCKACGAFLVPRETWQRPAQPKPRLRCKLCKAFLHSHNPGPYCTPCTNTMLTRGVHVLGAPRRIAQTDITA